MNAGRVAGPLKFRTKELITRFTYQHRFSPRYCYFSAYHIVSDRLLTILQSMVYYFFVMSPL